MSKTASVLLATLLVITGCQNACDVKDDINKLKSDRELLQQQTSNQRTILGARNLTASSTISKVFVPAKFDTCSLSRASNRVSHLTSASTQKMR
jgi:hypothetical protein